MASSTSDVKDTNSDRPLTPAGDSIPDHDAPPNPTFQATAFEDRFRATGLVDAIGNTPLLRLDAIGQNLPDTVSIFAKAEFMNPGGSVKDRPALRMIEEGIASGELTPATTLIDATSGNTGIAYALIGAARGINVTLAIPANASEERKQTLRAYGAELILTDPMEGTDGAQARVKEIVADAPDDYFYPNQYDNDANWRAHFDGTGSEIWTQTKGHITHFVAGLGTSGTFTGVTRRLREASNTITCISMQPDSPLHAMEGLKHMQTARVPGIYDDQLADRTITCRTEDALDMARRVAREEGILVGPSAGANVSAALRVAKELDEGIVVTILCDTGTRYLSDNIFVDDQG